LCKARFGGLFYRHCIGLRLAGTLFIAPACRLATSPFFRQQDVVIADIGYAE